MDHFWDSLDPANQLLKSFLAHTTDAFVVIDRYGKVLEVNEAFERLYGWARAELCGKPLPTVPAGLTEETLQWRQSVLHGGTVSGMKSVRLRKDGSRFAAGITMFPVQDNEGAVIAIAAIERDISEQPVVQAPLLEAEHFFRCLVEQALVGVYLYQDGNIIYVNPYLADMFGYTKDELLQLRFSDIVIQEEWRLIAEQARETLIHKKENYYFHIRGIRKDRSLINLECNSSIISYKGRPATYVTVQDVTYKKEAEILLLESVKRYQKLIEFLPEPLVVSDQGIILYANKSAMMLVNAANEYEVTGKSIFDYIHPEYHEDSMRVVQQVMQTDEPSHFVERKLICTDGQIKEAEISSIRIHNYFGKMVMLSVLRDLTDRKQAEELLIRSEKLSVIGQLAAGVAHEIRNPLTSLKGFNQILKSKYKDQAHYFEIMLDELDRINLIVNDFMTLAKPHLLKVNRTQADHIISSVIALLNTQAIMMNIRITASLDAPLPPVYCDENQLKQVFINIIKNAIEAMPRGGDITVTANRTDTAHIHIQIKDQGEGIPEAVISKIGEPFFTTKENGTGLGLMISYRIIESLKGTLQISSSEGRGTTVHIMLPVEE